MINWDTLTAMQMDALREIGNIGAGNAATALAQMVQRKINMEVPKAGVMRFEDIFHLVGTEEEVVACVNFAVQGEAPGRILFVLNQASTFPLVDMLMGIPMGTTHELDDMGKSAVQEIGNILTGSFLSAFSQVTGITFLASVPALAFDMLGAVLSTALIEGGYYSDRVLVIETQFYEQDVRLNGHFFLLPKAEALTTILNALGINQ
ncbi:chemotaxis protein CheY [Clostridiales bacterium PH28_bin88]|nr:chemotaxis protein CheY [Clostridiales bacterium PH28_bin88]